MTDLPYRYVTLEQRSPEWHEWRNQKITASEAAVIMGVSPYSTPHLLWKRKKGLAPPQPDNPGMARGRALEDEALALYNEHTGNFANPVCVERTDEDHAFMGASLDGSDIGGDIIVEIKAPRLEEHEMALRGEVPKKYWPQLQHQLFCKPDATLGHYWSYRPGHEQPTALVEVYRDDEYIARMIEVERRFWESLKGDTPPGGDQWEVLESAYIAALEQFDNAKSELESAKQALIESVPSGHKKADGDRLTVSVSEPKAGAVDYKKAFERALQSVADVSPEEAQVIRDQVSDFRRPPGKPSWRITVKKDAGSAPKPEAVKAAAKASEAAIRAANEEKMVKRDPNRVYPTF